MRKLANEIVTLLILIAVMYLIGNAEPIREVKEIPDEVSDEFAEQRKNTIKGKKILDEEEVPENIKEEPEKKSTKINYIQFRYLQKAGHAPSTSIDTGEIILDINTAGIKALCKIKGVGKSTAKSIIRQRNATGYFSSIDELRSVKGIGEKKLATIKKLVTSLEH